MIIQVGPYPPPYGGISVYIKRMKSCFDSKGIKNQAWDTSGVEKKEKNVLKMRLRFAPFRHLARRDIDLIHYNIPGIEAKNYIGFLNRLLFRNRKKILTIHGGCESLFDANDKSITKSLNSFDAIICVKFNDREYLLKQGIDSEIYEISAFIPPILSDEEIAKIPQTVWDFIASHKPIISANASAIRFYRNQDLYGIDMCVDLCAKLKSAFPEIGLVFCLPNIGNHGYFQKMKQTIVEKGVEDNFLLQTQPCEFYPILMKSHLFVRPTNTDGYSVSLAEAIYLRAPAIASDVCARPEGTILFKNRDTGDFTSKVEDVLDGYESYKENLEAVDLEDNFEKIMKVYQKLGEQQNIQS